LGNVVGSNIANIALILGVAALIGPLAIHSRVIRVDAPIMVGVSILLLVLIWNQVLSRAEGFILALGLVGFVVLTIRQGRTSPGHVLEDVTPVASDRRPGLLGGVAWSVTGLAVLILAGHLLVDAAVEIALTLHVEQATLGLTVVAVGTSLPELATSAVASWRGHGDIAVGNVIGSNIFNILGILGITAFVHPLQMGGLTWIDLGAMVAIAIVSMTMLFTGKRVGRLEGAALLASYVAYTVYLVSI
jgi:cation:H+ antiporter